MKLQRVTPLSEYRRERVSGDESELGFRRGGRRRVRRQRRRAIRRERRETRREERQERREARREDRQASRAERRGSRRGGRQPEGRELRRGERQAEEPSRWADVPDAPEPDEEEVDLEPAEEPWAEDEPLPEPEQEDLGLWRRRRKKGARAETPAPAAQAHPWSPPARMGPHLRIQASQGHRAAIIELRAGLYLVAEVAEPVVTNFGLAPVLAPLMVRAAAKAIARRQGAYEQGQPAAAPQQPRGLLALVRRPQAAPAPVPEIRRLPGPVADPSALPETQVLLPAPRLAAWAESDDLAGALGLELVR